MFKKEKEHRFISMAGRGKNSYQNMTAGVSVYSVCLALRVSVSLLAIVPQQLHNISISLFQRMSLKMAFALTLVG